MAEYIKKPWGWMRKVELQGSCSSRCWLAWMNPGGETSIHRHSCDSIVTCTTGTVFFQTFGFGDKPTPDVGRDMWPSRGEGVFIKAGEWHRISVCDGSDFPEEQAIFHEWYDLKDGETEYPIERYEGALS